MTDTVSGLRVPPGVKRAVMKALSKDPADRPESARAFKQELFQALETHLAIPTPSTARTAQDLPALPSRQDRPRRPLNLDTGTTGSTDALPRVPRSRAPFYLLFGVVVAVGVFFALRALVGTGTPPTLGPPRDGTFVERSVDVSSPGAADARARTDATSRPADTGTATGDAVDAAPAVDVPPTRSARIRVESTPPGAIVLLDGKRSGRTPTELTRPEAGVELKLELRLRGYYKDKRVVAEDAEDAIRIELKKRKQASKPPVLVP